MFFKKIAILLSLLTFALCGCSTPSASANKSTDTDTTSNTDVSTGSETTLNIGSSQDDTEQTRSVADDIEILNFTPPEVGEEIAVISVKDYGDIKIKLFEDECPKGVENFKRLISEKNYYDNVTFHRVIENFVIQAGDPTGSGSGGQSIWGEGFEREFNDGLRHFAGALSYATNSVDFLNKSQFYIVCQNTGSEFNTSYFNMIEDSYNTSFPNNVREKYQEVGGTPFLDGSYEVFGQVFEGMDIVLEIAQVDTDNNDQPYDDIIIESATIQEYDGTSSSDNIENTTNVIDDTKDETVQE